MWATDFRREIWVSKMMWCTAKERWLLLKILWSEAGKTSTLSILTGAILPSAGKAFLGGFDVVQEQRKALEDFETFLSEGISQYFLQ